MVNRNLEERNQQESMKVKIVDFLIKYNNLFL